MVGVARLTVLWEHYSGAGSGLEIRREGECIGAADDDLGGGDLVCM